MKTVAKRIMAFVLTFVIALTGTQLDVNSLWAEELDIITISTAEELEKIGVDEAYPMNGAYQLTSDLSDVQTTIGNSSTPFTGTFDGCGHSITLKIVTEENYKGLFGYIKDAVVKNVVVKGNIHTKYGWAAGITAKAVNSVITNCGSEVDIHSEGSNSTCFAGIAGYAENSTISECYNSGNIDGKIKNVAGIVGQTKTTATIENCYNTGTITTTATSSPRVGGIVGYGQLTSGKEGKVLNCYNAGRIRGTSQTGTFMGYIYTGYVVKNCHYLEGTHENVVGFNYQADIDDVKPVTEETLKMLNEVLGEAYTRVEGMNSDYPVLTWQVATNHTDEQDKATLEALVKELPSGVIIPKYSIDKNINTYISNIIESKEEYAGKGIQVSVKSVANRLGDTDSFIEADGTINYFYRNLFETMPNCSFGQADVVLEIRLNHTAIDYSPRCVNIYWDLSKVQADLETVAEEYKTEAILGDNTSTQEVTTNLSLPKYPIIHHNGEEKTVKWISTEYTSSNPQVIKISDMPEWDSSYRNQYYTAQVMRKEEETPVTITAKFTFERYNTGEEPVKEVITKEIPVLVSAGNEEEEAMKALQEKVDTYADYLSDFNNGGKINFAQVKNDIQLTIPKDLGLDGKEYEFKVESSDSSVMEVYGYRTYTYRPLPGQKAKNVTLNVTITNKENTNLSCSTKIQITVLPLTEQEITDALQFMESAKANLFDFIKKENSDANNIVSDMKTFYGIYQDIDGKIYETSYVDKPNNQGILVKMVNPNEIVPDNRRYWTSSNHEIVDDQTLRVKAPKYDTKIMLGTVLSHEIYENYAKRYADDLVYGEIFQKLADQKVTVDIIVKGTDGAKPVSVEKQPTPGKDSVSKKDNKIKKSKIVKKLKVKKFKTHKKKKSIKITWKKNKYADGYKIVYAKNKKFKKAKKIFVKSATKKSIKLKKLKKNNYYYVKMKAYKVVQGKCIYGTWTKVKRVKMK